MKSLKDAWQAERQQRQQQVLDRQQTVAELLTTMQQDREHQASQLWESLNQFRSQLVDSDQARRLEFQVFQADLQQSHLNLQAQTQAFLMAIAEHRQVEAHQMAEALHIFVQELQQRNAQFISMIAADRTLMAQQLAQELQTYQQKLQALVRSLRQQMQGDLADLKADTQAFLIDRGQFRLQMQQQQQQELANFIDTLRADVQDYLGEVASLRQQRAEQLSQTLSQQRAERTAELQAMFDRLADFRTELRQFHQGLQQQVWGDHNPAVATQLPEVAQPVVSSVKLPSAMPVAKPAASKASLKPAIKSTVVPTRPMATLPAKVTQPQRSVHPAIKSAKSPAKDEMAYEKAVYSFLHTSQGARLTQIESSLGINRFQAVDALRSLIKKGLVTQRDRVYHIQGDLVPS